MAAARKTGTTKKKAAPRSTTRKRKPPVKNEQDPARGTRLNASLQAIRDTRMIARLGQGWTWEMVAEEAGLSLSQAKRAVAARRAAVPLTLSMDPVEMIERTFEGFQLSIGDFEALAADAAARNQLSVAVGAKKGANEAREKVLTLLQLTNRLPQELGALRHLIDLRAIAVKMLDTMDQFDRAIAAVELTEEQRQDVDDAVANVRQTWHEILGFEDAPPTDAEAFEEQPALPGPAE